MKGNDVKVWDYAMSGDELEELRSDANHYSNKFHSLMWDKGFINQDTRNSDVDNFTDLTNNVWRKYSKEKSYDECIAIIETELNKLLKKYDLEWK